MTLSVNDRLHLAESAKRLLNESNDIESVIAFLQKSGADKIDSILIVREITGREFNDCKALVHLSKAWENTRDRDERLHDLAEAAIRDISKDQT